jgi:addiction module RelE/StbE family toxin
MRIVLDENAVRDLQKIRAWIGHDNPTAARAVIARLFETFNLLATFPRIGRAGRQKGTREWAVPRLPYLIVYEPDFDRDELIVTAVFHGAQDREQGI